RDEVLKYPSSFGLEVKLVTPTGGKRRHSQAPDRTSKFSHVECRKCHELGHIARFCPSNSAKKSSPVRAGSKASYTSKQAHKYFLTILTDPEESEGIRASFILDTGSDVSIIRKELIEDVAGIEKEEADIEIELADGSTRPAHYFAILLVKMMG
ncbi:hypothetical protein ADUPG1_004995, partial [Aduncisulcus paluster]